MNAAQLLRASVRGSFLPPVGEVGTVHSVFGRACNLLFPKHGLLALLAPNLPMTSWAIRLAELPLYFTEWIIPGQLCQWNGESVTISTSLRVDVVGAALWCGDQFPPGMPGKQVAWESLRCCVAKRGWPGWCALLDPKNKATELGNGDDIILSVAANAVRRLLRARAQGDINGAVVAACSLIGLGLGLTPSGDDFLGGWLAGLFAQSPGGSKDADVRAFTAQLMPHLEGRTGKVAAMFLSRACVGSFSENLVNLARSLVAGDATPKQLVVQADRIFDFGATSGADTLAGFLASAWNF